MNPWTKAVNELRGFTEFGGLMDPESREFAVQLLFRHLYDPSYASLSALQQSSLPQQFPNWDEVFRQILEDAELRELTQHNEDFSLSVTRETLNWCKNTYLRFENQYPYQEETHTLQQAARLEETSPEDWMIWLRQLPLDYPSQRKNWEFYLQQVQQAAKEGNAHANNRTFALLTTKIREEWNQLFLARRQHAEAAFLDRNFPTYFQHIQGRIENLNDLGNLMAPYYSFFGHAWNQSLGNWNKIPWPHLESYAKKLQQDPQLKELAELLGRWQMIGRQREEIQHQQLLVQPDWSPNPYGKSEITGVHHSDHLSAMLPSEIALLSYPETELILAKKFVEKKLLTFQYRARDMGAQPQQKEMHVAQSSEEERGPMILCVDTSGSMYGEPEQIAKALALAILNIAIEDDRKAYLISFSSGIETFEMTGMQDDFTLLLEFLQKSFHGGTDLQPALMEAVKMLEEKDFAQADILVISDFVIPTLDKKLLEQIEEVRRSRGTHFHSLFITRGADSRAIPLPLFDHHWVYDFQDPKVLRQTFDHFQELRE